MREREGEGDKGSFGEVFRAQELGCPGQSVSLVSVNSRLSFKPRTYLQGFRETSRTRVGRRADEEEFLLTIYARVPAGWYKMLNCVAASAHVNGLMFYAREMSPSWWPFSCSCAMQCREMAVRSPPPSAYLSATGPSRMAGSAQLGPGAADSVGGWIQCLVNLWRQRYAPLGFRARNRQRAQTETKTERKRS